ncbi:hypothetical protein N0V90_008447 [Kalmusia sp. IMI 367209]|nr:hypothetical protein N0V90_008447 [Kalmusia sp. IMI 367209]
MSAMEKSTIDSGYMLAPDKSVFFATKCFRHTAISSSPHEWNGEICPICLCEYGTGRDGDPAEYPLTVEIPTCKHVFGDHCMVELLNKEDPSLSKCPLCRTKWFATPEDDECWEDPNDVAQWSLDLDNERMRPQPRTRFAQFADRGLAGIKRILRIASMDHETDDPTWTPTEEEERIAQAALDTAYDQLCSMRRIEMRAQGLDYPEEECEAHREEAAWSTTERWSSILGTWKCVVSHTLRDYRNVVLGLYRHKLGKSCPICTYGLGVNHGQDSQDVIVSQRSVLGAISGRRTVEIIHY